MSEELKKYKHAIGIIANPASGKDIRRMVAYGNAYDNTDKMSIVQRVLMAASVTGIDAVYYMNEYYGIVENAVSRLHVEHKSMLDEIAVLSAENESMGIELDTVWAAQNMEDRGVRCIVTLGGDGTNRAVAKGCGDIPLMPISTGTNNVFPQMIEGTVAGMAAGLFASGRLGNDEDYIKKTKCIELLCNGEQFDVALIDAIVVRDEMIASRALWKTDSFYQVFLSQCSPESIGISSIGGQLHPVSRDDPMGLNVCFDKDAQKLTVPLAPGLMGKVGIRSFETMDIGREIEIPIDRGVIAVDGEREIELKPGNHYSARLSWNGPRLIDTHKILHDAQEKRLFFENE